MHITAVLFGLDCYPNVEVAAEKRRRKSKTALNKYESRDREEQRKQQNAYSKQKERGIGKRYDGIDGWMGGFNGGV